jgi:hypothetical protein
MTNAPSDKHPEIMMATPENSGGERARFNPAQSGNPASKVAPAGRGDKGNRSGATRDMTAKNQRALVTSKGGRPTLYQDRYAEEGRKLCELMGATDAQMADFWGVHENTISNWKRAHPEFAEEVRRGKIWADAQVAEALYRRGIGYSHPAVKILQHEGKPVVVEYTKHYPPDPQACIFWLKNRQPELWKDVKSREVANTNRDVNMTLEEERRIALADAEEVRKSLQPPPMVLEPKPQGDTE